MSGSNLMLHAGGQLCSGEELRQIPTPSAEGRWHPVSHAAVLDTVTETLLASGYTVKSRKLAVARNGQRFFGTLDLSTPLTPDGSVALAVGIRNSVDKSFPLGFCAGSKCFVCDNLAFRAELLVKRKHTRFAAVRWNNEIAHAVGKIPSFAEAEQGRIALMQQTEVTEDRAYALILRAFERSIISSFVIGKVLKEWAKPTFDYGTGDRPTLWRLLNSFTTVLGGRAVSNPGEYAGQTIRLNQLLAPAAANAA